MPRWINDLSTLLSRRQILLAAALLVLMLAVIQGLDDPVGKTLVVAHFGLFLLWQPVVRARYRLAARDLLIMTGVLGALLAVLSAGVMVVWVVVLTKVIAF